MAATSTAVRPRLRTVRAGKRAWLLSFSELLLLLLAFFILRLAVAPYRQGQVVTTDQSYFKELNIVRFKKVGNLDGIRSFIGSSMIAESKDDFSFQVKEEFGTLARAFGGGDFTFSIAPTSCGKTFNTEIDRKLTASVSSVISQFLDDGVSKECLIVSNLPGQSADCSQNFDALSNENSGLVITIEQRSCNPL